MTEKARVADVPGAMSRMCLEELLVGQMLLIRKFEERVLDLFAEGVFFGTTHCYIGQEAIAVGIINHLTPTDIVWSSHRCHGHYLAFTGDAEGLMAELMGKATGVVGGRGGSQHLCRAGFFSNGVQGGIVPVSTGMAFAEKYRRTGNIVVVFLGDGTLGEGVVYESFNLASLWKLPVLFVIENNRYAQSTPVERQLAGSMVARPRAFGIETTEIASFDATEIFEVAGAIISRVRSEQKPCALVIHTYRFCHHSKSDDHRDPREVESWLPFDPLKILGERVNPVVFKDLETRAVEQVRAAEEAARRAPFPSLQGKSLDELMEL